MFKKLAKLFKEEFEEKEETKEAEQAPEPEPEPEPAPPPPPEIIEVPYKIAVRVKNADDTINKIHSDLKDFFYSVKIKEKEAFDAIDRMKDLKKDIIKEIRSAYNAPESEYDFEPSETPGKPAFLKRKK